MTAMTSPIPVDELRARDDAEFPVKPGTNEETALRFLAANPDYGWPPASIADRTDIPASSVTKTVARLHEKGLVERVSGYYFVPPERLAEVQGTLGDLQQLRVMAGEPGQTPVHPAGRAEPGDDGPTDAASADEVDDIVQEIAEPGPGESGP